MKPRTRDDLKEVKFKVRDNLEVYETGDIYNITLDKFLTPVWDNDKDYVVRYKFKGKYINKSMKNLVFTSFNEGTDKIKHLHLDYSNENLDLSVLHDKSNIIRHVKRRYLPLTDEGWKNIPTFPDYDANIFGEIFSRLKGVILEASRRPKPGEIEINEYKKVKLVKGGKSHDILVHRAIVEAFIRPLEKGEQVNHIDEFKCHNYPSNLEIVSNIVNCTNRSIPSPPIKNTKTITCFNFLIIIYINNRTNEVYIFPDYTINTHGDVRDKNGVLMTPQIDPNGYPCLKLVHQATGKKMGILIHKATAHVHVPNLNPDKDRFINHKNSDRSDPRAVNLEWCDYTKNNRHASGIHVEQIDMKTGDLIKIHDSFMAAAEVLYELKIKNSRGVYSEIKCISKMISNKCKKANIEEYYGFHWRFSDPAGDAEEEATKETTEIIIDETTTETTEIIEV